MDASTSDDEDIQVFYVRTKSTDQAKFRAWIEDRVMNSPRGLRPGQFAAIAAVDANDKITRVTTHGEASGVTYDQIEDLFFEQREGKG